MTGEDRLYLFLMLAQISLVWLLPWFPTQDGPSHVYNAAILHDLLRGGNEWGAYFTYKLDATPNLGFNLIVYPLLFLVAPLYAERIFLTLYLILMGIAADLLIRTFAPSAPFSRQARLLAIPVMFNFTLMMGFYSYVIAVPIFLLAMAMAWHIRNRPWIVRFLGYNAGGVVIFYLHLIPFIVYLMALSIFATVEQRTTSDAAVSLARKLPLIAPLLVLVTSYFFSAPSAPLPADLSYLLSGERFISLLADLFTFSTVYFSPWQLIPASLYLFVVLLLLVALVRGRGRETGAGQRAMLILAAALTVIYLVAPFRLGEGSFFNDRFPWVILLLLLPPLAGIGAQSRPVVRYGGIAGCLLFIAINAACFWQQNREVALFTAGMSNNCAKGDGIMLYRTTRTAWSKIDAVLHAPSYYGIFNGCVDLGNYEAGHASLFPVQFRKSMQPLPPNGLIEGAPDSIDFHQYPSVKSLVAWDLKAHERLRLEKWFNCTFENSKLSIWSRR